MVSAWRPETALPVRTLSFPTQPVGHNDAWVRKRTPLSAYSVQHRGGGGIGTITSSFDKTVACSGTRVKKATRYCSFRRGHGDSTPVSFCCHRTDDARSTHHDAKGRDQVASMTRVSVSTTSSPRCEQCCC